MRANSTEPVDVLSSFQKFLNKAEKWGGENWDKVNKFIEKHFRIIGFCFSSAVMLAANPLLTLSGIGIGVLLNYKYRKDLKVGDGNLIPAFHTTASICGMAASLLSYTPAGRSGGIVFRAIPLLASISIGDVLCRINVAHSEA